MTNPWQSLTMNFGVSDDSFNAVVSNSSYLDLGTHPGVFIEGLEPATARSGNTFLRIVWSNDDKQTIKDSAFMDSRPDDNGNIHPHFTLRRLVSALIPDQQLRTEFMGAAKSNPGLFAALVGLRADIKIGYGREGYTVKEAPTGGYLLWDVGEKRDIGTDTYDSYSAAKEAAEGLELKRSFNEITSMTPSQEYQEDNLAAVRNTLAAAAKPGGGNSAIKPVAVGNQRRM